MNVGRLIAKETFAALPPNFTLTKVIGIWWEITRPYFSFVILINLPTLTAQLNAIRVQGVAPHKIIGTLLPEAFHQITIVMIDRGIPASFQHMHFFGSHTYSLYNAYNQRFWCKFHFKTQQGIKNLTNEETEKINGIDREYHEKDLFDVIERGDFPKYTMYIHIMTEEQALNHRKNPFDITKNRAHAEYPLMEVGVYELNRNPENYFAEVEQAALSSVHVVPGIGFSPDKLLHGRFFCIRGRATLQTRRKS